MPQATRGACSFIKKENLALVFSCDFCEIFNNTFLQNKSGRPLRNWTSEILSNRSSQSFTEPLDPSHRDGYIQKQLFGGVL